MKWIKEDPRTMLASDIVFLMYLFSKENNDTLAITAYIKDGAIISSQMEDQFVIIETNKPWFENCWWTVDLPNRESI